VFFCYFVVFAFVVLGLVSFVLSQELGWEEHRQNDLFCDEWDVKPSLSQAHTLISFLQNTDRHPFNGLFSRTTWITRHQKGKTNLDFNEARNDGVAVASAGPYADHLHLAADR